MQSSTTIFSGISSVADDKRLKIGATVSTASTPLPKPVVEDRKSVSTDVSRGLVQGGGLGVIIDTERKKITDANGSRAASAPSSTGNSSQRFALSPAYSIISYNLLQTVL